ncbi:MAG: hypothetical protein AB7I50_00175 [Vicinamibacterales bacterium]
MRTLRRLAVVAGQRPASQRLASYVGDVCQRAGIEVTLCTADRIPESCDAVLALGPDVPKLTPIPTYGWLLLPWLEYQSPIWLRNVLGWDGFVTATERVEQWINDISFGARKRAPVLMCAPAPPAIPSSERSEPPTTALILPGSHAIDQLRGVSGAGLMAPENELLPQLQTARAGVWLESPTAVHDDHSSLELLEIVAAGALAVTTRSGFTDRWFGDTLLYLDADAPEDVLAWQVERHLHWIRANPLEAHARATRARAIFTDHLSLDRLPGLLETLHKRVVEQKGSVAATDPARRPSVAYVVRTDGDPDRVLRSLERQNYHDLRAFIVSRSPGIDVSEVARRFPSLSCTVLPPVSGTASAPLWHGLRAVRESGADVFGLVDDRDELFPNHVGTVVDAMQNMEGRSWFGSFAVAYSGAVECARGEFTGDRWAHEHSPPTSLARRIRHFRFYHPGYLDEGAHEVHPGALLARTALLDDEVLADPELDDGAERYLQLLLAEKSLFAFACEVTVATHDREDDLAQSRQVRPLDETRQRIFFRTYGRQFPSAAVYLHNVIFMTAFDKDLLAPIIQANSFDARRPSAVLDLQPLGSARVSGRAVDVMGTPGAGIALAADAFTAGRYRLRCYFSAPAPTTVSVPFDVRPGTSGGGLAPGAVVSLLSVRSMEQLSVAEYELHLSSEDAAVLRGLTVEAHEGTSFVFVGARIDRLARVMSRSVLDLPVDRPVWLYGAGQGGRQAKRKLELVGLQVSGFIDKFKTGTVDGLPVLDLTTASGELKADSTLIIASMFWEEIRHDIEAAGVSARLYSLYPFTGDVVYALN